MIKESLKKNLDYLNNKELQDYDIGIMGEKSGIIFLNLEQFDITNDEKYIEKAFDTVSSIYDSINKVKFNSTYSSGLAGFSIILQHINENYQKIDLKLILEDIDKIIKRDCLKFIEEKNFDFLHGALGICFTFLWRNINLEVLEKMVNQLLKESIKIDDEKIGWKINTVDEDLKYNLGLAHGIPAIVIFLKECIKRNIEKEKADYLIDGALKLIINSKQDLKENKSYFPYSVRNNMGKEDSRLAWCYGDLSVALCLWHASKLKKYEYLKIEVYDILNNCINRKEKNDTKINDASLCHGTSGIALIYDYFYKEIKNEKYKILSKYWINESEKYKIDGLFYYSYQNDQEIIIGGLLEGISGIALSILSLNEKTEKKWLKYLLIK